MQRLNGINVIQIVLIILKLIGLINWSWWLVLSPTLFCFGIATVIIIIVIIMQIRSNIRIWKGL